MVWNLIKNLVLLLSGEEDEEHSEEMMENESKEAVGDDVNGLFLCNKMIPVEILCSILQWVDEDTLVLSCRRVCREWKQVTDELVWEAKINSTKRLVGPRSTYHIPWWVSYWIAKKGIFDRNLIRNNCGQAKMKHWTIKENYGDMWKVEKTPEGAVEPLPQCEEIGANKSCFVTSYHWCSKEQLVELKKVGLTDKIMDEIQPDFEFSDWIGSRFDCGGMYGLRVFLEDAAGNTIQEVTSTKRLEAGDSWAKVEEKIIGPYGPGARFIRFHHKGKDTQFWKGHYGIKITGSCLKPIFPKERFLTSQDLSSPE